MIRHRNLNPTPPSSFPTLKGLTLNRMRKTRYQTKVRETDIRSSSFQWKFQLTNICFQEDWAWSQPWAEERKKFLPVDKKRREKFLTSFLCFQYSFLSWMRNHSFIESSHHEHIDPPGEQRFMKNWNEATSQTFWFCNCLWFPWKVSIQSFIITMQLSFRSLATWTATMSGLFPSFELNQLTLILDFGSGP